VIRDTGFPLQVFVAAALCLIASYAGAQNLLSNPSFDSDGTGWVVPNSNVEAVFRSDLGSTLPGGSGPGSIEVRFSFWNGGSAGVYQEVAVVEGTTYTTAVSAYAPADNNPATDAPLVIQWYDSGHTIIELDTYHPTFVNNQWMRIEATVTAPAGAAIIRVYPTVKNPVDPMGTLPGILYIDDVWLAEEGSGSTVQEAFYPAGASIAGLAGTFWTTDGWFRSTSGSEVELWGAFLPQRTNNSAAVASPIVLGAIPAGGSLVIDDIVAALGGVGQTGGVYLRAEAIGGTQLPFLFATSYTSTPNPVGGGSYGQGIPAVGPGARGKTVAPGAFQNTERRTNAGALNTSPVTITLRVNVIDQNGSTVGAADWNLPPYAQQQVSLPKLGVSNLDGGSVVFELLSGSGSYRGYTSTVDAITGDAVYTAAQ